jgi:hypothetical protein
MKFLLGLLMSISGLILSPLTFALPASQSNSTKTISQTSTNYNIEDNHKWELLILIAALGFTGFKNHNSLERKLNSEDGRVQLED